MKKFIYTFVVLFACALTVSAQKVMGTDCLGVIPSYFTYNHNLYLTDVTEKEVNDDYVKTYFVYDLNLDLVWSFEPQSREDRPAYVSIEICYDKNGMKHNSQNFDFFQTLFNDDEDWEYVSYEEDGYSIKKLDGTVIGRIPECWTREILIYGDVVYTYTREDKGDYEYIYTYYTIPEFRKLIGTETGVQAVPAFTRTISKEAYDLAGRKASDNQRGLVVKDGKKMLMK